MGIRTPISLEEVDTLFPSYKFTKLLPTQDGIIDTTYIVSNTTQSYILKKYERNIADRVEKDKKVLSLLYADGLNVSLCLENSQGWYLYKKLEGSVPKVVQIYHIQALARFMAKLHHSMHHIECKTPLISSTKIKTTLQYLKKNYYFYYIKLKLLKNYKDKSKTLIHGDIFKDNTVFHKGKIAVFDFIDAGCGSFVFDIAVALISFKKNHLSSYFIDIFLNTYNQFNRKKIAKVELEKTIKVASIFYAMVRVDRYKNITKAKELL